jgi:hypothetical protein
MGRGGYRAPGKPAPVSGPGELSQRTDSKQPIRVASGGAYGERQALEAQQAAAPLPQTAGPPQAPTVMSRPGGPGAFGPTQRPWEDPLSGLKQPSIIPDDPDLLLRSLYQLYPSPDIARLLRG